MIVERLFVPRAGRGATQRRGASNSGTRRRVCSSTPMRSAMRSRWRMPRAGRRATASVTSSCTSNTGRAREGRSAWFSRRERSRSCAGAATRSRVTCATSQRRAAASPRPELRGAERRGHTRRSPRPGARGRGAGRRLEPRGPGGSRGVTALGPDSRPGRPGPRGRRRRGSCRRWTWRWCGAPPACCPASTGRRGSARAPSSRSRVYQPGDDVRQLDPAASARTGLPHVRLHVPERLLTAWIVLDVSPSMAFGTALRLKSDVAAGTASVLARLAVRLRDEPASCSAADATSCSSSAQWAPRIGGHRARRP